MFGLTASGREQPEYALRVGRNYCAHGTSTQHGGSQLALPAAAYDLEVMREVKVKVKVFKFELGTVFHTFNWSTSKLQVSVEKWLSKVIFSLFLVPEQDVTV